MNVICLYNFDDCSKAMKYTHDRVNVKETILYVSG